MKINRTNYEIFFIDYNDGKLNPHEISQLKTFLQLNTDLQEEFDMFSQNESITEIENIVFEHKNSLKKVFIPKNTIITSNNFNDFVIAEIEGELSTNESFQLHQHLNENPDLKKEYNLFQLTKLKPEYSIVFENKKGLKKRSKRQAIIRQITYVSAIAAGIALMFTIFNKVDTSDNTTYGKMSAQINENLESKQYIEVKTQIKSNKNPNSKVYNINKNTIKVSSSNSGFNNTTKNNNENIEIEQIKPKAYKNIVEEPQLLNLNKPVIVADLFEKEENNELPILIKHEEPRKDLASIKNWVISVFKKNVLGKDVKIEESINALDIANIGLAQISKVINKDYSFEPKFADNGRLVALGIKNNKK